MAFLYRAIDAQCPFKSWIVSLCIIKFRSCFLPMLLATDYWLLLWMENNSFARLLARAIYFTKMNLLCGLCYIYLHFECLIHNEFERIVYLCLWIFWISWLFHWIVLFLFGSMVIRNSTQNCNTLITVSLTFRVQIQIRKFCPNYLCNRETCGKMRCKLEEKKYLNRNSH